jgi:glucan phosphoethanolaminetransferase (alkaline phosphatase superfamily)
MTMQSSLSAQPNQPQTHPKKESVNQAFGCLGIGIAFTLNIFSCVSAFFLIASGFEFSRDAGILVFLLVVVSYIIVYRIHQLIKNPGITILVYSEKRSLDNIYPVYLLLILFVFIQSLFWVADPSSENHEPRTYFMTLVSGALIYSSGAYRKFSKPLTVASSE